MPGSKPLRRTSPGPAGKLSIGALSRASGIPIETLRTWERRYGFPIPERKPSGHRVYSLADVPRLRRIAEALAQGHRAGEVVSAPDRELEALIATGTPDASGGGPLSGLLDRTPGETSAGADIPAEAVLDAIRHTDTDRLTRLLLVGWGRLGPVEYFDRHLGPLLRQVGEAWEGGRLEIGDEHFFSERLSDLLRSLRLPFEDRARGSSVVLATLPGEGHDLALQMAALVLAAAGWRTVYLGTEAPAEDIARVARDHASAAVAISISSHTEGAATHAALLRLREILPRRTQLLVGGAGAPESNGVHALRSFAELDAYARGEAKRPDGPGRTAG